MVMGNLVLSESGLSVGEGDACCLPWEEDGGVGTMGEGGGGTEDET